MKFFVCTLLLLQGSSQCNGLDGKAAGRRLFEKIHTYSPLSLVTDVASIDRDLLLIKQELRNETWEGWDDAESVYHEGAYSKPVAELALNDALPSNFPSGTAVRGLAIDGSEVSGRLFDDAYANEHHVLVQYDINEAFSNYVNCQVGGNPDPNVDGCKYIWTSVCDFIECYPNSCPFLLLLAGFNDTGWITVDGRVFSYEYDVYEENYNYRTIADLSNDAEEKMWECSHCPITEFRKFYEYYEEFNYADRIISSAFNAQKTNMKNGNMDFGLYSDSALSEFIHMAMSRLSIWMYTIRQMEQAVAECDKGNYKEGVHFWDEAVAYYSGSRSIQPETNGGELVFGEAELRCKAFATCGESSDSLEGMAYTNIEAFKHFEHGQNSLDRGKCRLAKEDKERIAVMMTIPLIQGTLRYAHIVASKEEYNDEHGAKAALYALSVLPLVHSCSKDDAETIYENLKSKDSADVDFSAVKNAFENNYKCLNIQCSEVGGIWDWDLNDYKPGASPCQSEDSSSWPILGGIAVGLLIVSGIGFILLRRRRAKVEKAVEEINRTQDSDINMDDDNDDYDHPMGKGDDDDDDHKVIV
eukprot:scaffold834_cov123-Cylindrotheca_fusiformis.AAC.32